MESTDVKKNIWRYRSDMRPTRANTQNSWMAGTNVRNPTARMVSSVITCLEQNMDLVLTPKSHVILVRAFKRKCLL